MINFLKHTTLSLIAALFLTFSATASDLKASFSYCSFHNPEKGPYLETYLSVDGNSVRYVKTDDGTYKGKIEVVLIFRQGEEIKNFKKYNLSSPKLDDTTGKKVNFIDQQRIPLSNGKYEFEIQLKDLNNADHPPFSTVRILEIDYPRNAMGISDIQFIESIQKSKEKSIITKSGYDLVPYVSNFFPGKVEKIKFYAEIYNSSKYLGENGKYLINYFIESEHTGEIVGNYKSFRRENAEPVNIVLNQFDITDLPTGNYFLVMEARNKENELLVKKRTYFQRSNPNLQPAFSEEDIGNTFVSQYNKEELKEYIASVQPIADNLDRSFYENQLKDADLTFMQQYFYNFWVERNPENPKEAWKAYHTKVKKADKSFGTQIDEGYETDRGRIYLQYGPPNSIVQRVNEPSAYPYEIWHYYKIADQRNKKFVFYNPDLVTNDYILLHSDVIGEVNNYQWKVIIHGRNTNFQNLDNNETPDHYGGRLDDFYNSPR